VARPVPRRLLLLDSLAALGFALLPQLAIARLATSAAGSSAAWLLSAAAALPLCFRRLWPVPVFLSVLALSCAAVPFGLGPASFLAAAYALYLVAVTQPPRHGPPAALVGGLSTAGAVALTMGGSGRRGGDSVVQVVLGVVVMGATWAAGRAVRERRETTRRTIEEAAERAKAAERLRIAREMHDVVTHSMGLIAIKAGVANHVLLSHPEEAKSALGVIEDVSRAALREMRAMLGVLRPDRDGGTASGPSLRPAPGLADLRGLAQTAGTAGARVELDVRQEDEVPDGAALAAFRIVQEALTNVVKHAAPTTCLVRIVAAGGQLTIDVADTGPPAAHRPRPDGSRLGLIGMRERATAHGGTVSAGPRPEGGFRVRATLRY
jgi:signal transduction histidine kinase